MRLFITLDNEDIAKLYDGESVTLPMQGKDLTNLQSIILTREGVNAIETYSGCMDRTDFDF